MNGTDVADVETDTEIAPLPAPAPAPSLLTVTELDSKVAIPAEEPHTELASIPRVQEPDAEPTSAKAPDPVRPPAMTGSALRTRKPHHEPTDPMRGFGAWDDPGVSVFATAAQEPIPNMLSYLKPMPGTACDQDKDTCKLKSQKSVAENSLFRLIKYQVEELAADRHTHMNPKQRLERTDGVITAALAEELHRQQVAASRRIQLHRNVNDLRRLKAEVDQAHTALVVRQTILENERQAAEIKQKERNKALAEKRQLEQEQRAEEMKKGLKASTFRRDLIIQITEAREKRQKDQQAMVEEGRRERREFLAKVEEDRIQDIIKLAKSRRELMEGLQQSVAQSSANREVTAKASKGKPERGILDALGPVTATYVGMERKRRHDEIEARDINAARLGFQLSQIKHEIEAREQLITNLLIRECQAKDSELALNQARQKMALKREIRDQLLSQRDEQKFFRDKAIQQSMLKPKDPTSFGERQYRNQVAQAENTHRLDVQAYKDLAVMIEAGKKRRAENAEEMRQMNKRVYDLQDIQDKLVAVERMEILGKQPREVLSALRTALLTPEEIKTFNLAK